MELVQGAQHAYGPSIAAQKEIEALRKVFVTIDTDRDGRISEAELNKVLAKLDYRPRKGEVADMIWEVDEDCDRHVSWAEFELMFIRCRSDMAGLEPRRLFDLAEFLMHDKDGSGKVPIDEVMEITFKRYGKSALEERTHEFFSSAAGDNEVSYAEFQRQMLAYSVKKQLGHVAHVRGSTSERANKVATSKPIIVQSAGAHSGGPTSLR